MGGVIFRHRGRESGAGYVGRHSSGGTRTRSRFNRSRQITYCRSGGKPLKPTDEYIAV